ncbi:coiled-coil protein [Legionella gratiana]|uniref:Coiled-coil protein n=1 Tax=Legionella gratiana TaxID=45066 RepID=A0A378JGA9_9GAMM|nr:zeta toxin family protein [Legionella gratiana]KTD13668.1 coiled-coil protein [Legionella gratiana]STX46021.1 coiled-coil protein [Legionella gratiana]
MQNKIDETIKYIENVPATQVLELIKSGIEPIYTHTNLQSCQRPKLDIAEIMACNAAYTKTEKPKYPSVQSLITYPIERLVYFDTIATLETEVQCGEELDLYKYIDYIYDKVSKINFKEFEQAIKETAKITALKAFDTIHTKEELDPSLAKYKEVYDRIKAAFENEQYQVSTKFLMKHHINPEEAFPLLVKMTMEDMVYNEEMKKCIQMNITPKIKEIIDQVVATETPFPIHDSKGNVIGEAPLQKLSVHQGEERVTFMLAGAPASGKGTILARVLHEAKTTRGIDERDMVKINTDTHRILVCQGYQEQLGTDKELHVSLNNDEASYITLMGYEKMRQKISQNCAPHMLIDGVAPANDRIQLGTQNNGKLEISIVTVDPESSVKRAQHRGESTGRYVQTSYLINSHRNVTVATYDMLSNQELVGTKDIQVSIYDTNVPQGTTPVYVAWIDMKDKKAEIYDSEKLAEFRGKRHIEPILNRDQFFSHQRKRNLSISSNEILFKSGYDVNENNDQKLDC